MQLSRAQKAPDARLPSDLRKLLTESRYEDIGTIRRTCDAIARWLVTNQDNVRDFFRECYLPLVTCVFGLERPGMLTLAEPRPSECSSLLSLLKPDGILFRGMQEVDSEGLNQYQLPTRMLAAHTQMLLSSPAGIAALQKWPQYTHSLTAVLHKAESPVPSPSPAVQQAAGTAAHQPADAAALPPSYIVLPLTTSFLMLLAYTAVHMASSPAVHASSSPHLLHTGAHSHFHLPERINNMLHPSNKHTGPQHSSPYLSLLRMYLQDLLPQPPPSALSPPSLSGGPACGAILLSAMIESWLTDVDVPAPAVAGAASTGMFGGAPGPAIFGSARAGFSGQQAAPLARMSTFVAPSQHQIAALQELLSHIFVRRGSSPLEPAQTTFNWLPLECALVSTAVSGYPLQSPIHASQTKAGLSRIAGPSASPAVQNVTAHVYRLLRRAFTLWPAGQQTERLAAVRRLWLSICFPWSAAGSGQRYSRAWQPHVLAHLPFYHVLLPVFLDLMLACATYAADVALRETTAVAKAFAAEPELLELLAEAEDAMARHHAGQPLPASQFDVDLRQFVPLVALQASALEHAAAAGVVKAPGTTPVSVEPNPQFRLLLRSLEPSAHALLHRRGAPGRAADVVDALQGQVPADSLTALKDALAFMDVERFSLLAGGRHLPDMRCGLRWRMVAWGGPAHIAVEKVPYIGEWLMRPVAHNEFKFLVPWLAALSIWLNNQLGFTDDARLHRLHASAQRCIKSLKGKGVYVDLRRVFEYQSIMFLAVCSLLMYGIWLLIAMFTHGELEEPFSAHVRQTHLQQ